ncbi:MAG TPA: 4-hydroxy-tetrahydrodipicolinate synthase [Thermomicrobiaceae bacterium]|nr:4-hydroxy-tetrahydrodipicolinate synthase [Thermomicrobiaceae bacterium]
MDRTTDISRLRGSMVPLVTPFKDGAFDEPTFRDLIEFQIASGSHGVSVAGSTGEPSALSLEEREHVIETAVRAVDGRVPVIPGTGTNNHDETVRLTTFAERAGADAALVMVPYYNRPSQEGLYQHFVGVARQTSLPIIIYNIPGRTAVNMEPETVARVMKAAGNVVGVKEANKDFEQVTKLFDRCGRDILVYSGIEALCFPLLALGGAGYISATGNVLPSLTARLYDLAATGRWDEARDLHYEMFPMNEALFWETNPGPVKYVLGLMGKITPELRLPLVLPSPENQRRLRAVAERYHLIPAAAGVSGDGGANGANGNGAE